MMDFLQAVYRCWNFLHPRLQLQREIERIVPRLVQIAAVEPQRLLLGRLPHIALLALPRPWILGGVRAETPDLSALVGNLLRDEVGRPAVHRAITGGVNDDVGR